MKVFEFIGVPGSGKSTLTEEVIRSLENSGLKVASYSSIKNNLSFNRGNYFERVSNIMMFFIFILLNINIIYSIIRIVENKCKMDTIYYTYVFMRNLFQIYKLKKEYELVVLDEGFVQKLWSISINNKINFEDEGANLFEKIVNKLDLSYSLIFVEIDLQEAINRILARGKEKGRFNKLARSELESMLNKNYLELYMLSQSLREHVTLTLNGEYEVHVNKREVLAVIR
ncbi:AAA family ATPase [Salisediminibacterium halotolerans]|uniref:AAA domain-containing protein n=1 Tax=Salisediminibacterium halotolerans TaxID=517425 RepID=A0A1H9QH94_9BACI|nr:AAA family ATPase [Salisediminibacterium haloalkalitolerans]SER59808.1 AAA domain-containing protein [Salisediminibacterium haloalkalitolerans]